MGATLISAEDIKKRYEMGQVHVYALKGVNFTLREKELVVVLGESGSGKTTLVNIVGGMDRPTEGRLHFGQIALHDCDEAALTDYRRNQVGFIFQFYNLMPNLTARENIHLAVEIARDPLNVEELLRQVGLGDRGNHFPSQLSGGEQQRVAIARALAKNPRLLLCDEPTGALDLPTGRQILSLLSEFRDRYGKTVVIITHNTNISRMADRIVYLKDGKVEWVKKNEKPIPAEEVSW